MYCYKCGREIEENVSNCPFCGAKQGMHHEEEVHKQAEKFNVLCIVGFALSISSVVLSFSFLTSLAGLIVSIVGVIDCNKKHERGRVFGIIGIVIGAIGLIFWLFIFSQVFGVYNEMLDPFMEEMIPGEIL